MINIEVCIDNIESLFTAQTAGAGRIELCSALTLGGLTPSHGLVAEVLKHAHLPVYSMIRPREGDFLYSSFEVEMMLNEIHTMRTLGVQGVVFGVLNKMAQIDKDVLKSLMQESKGLGVTFHCAIDCCADVEQALEIIMSAGCERILTSGLACNAIDGVETIAHMVEQGKGRISVMAGAGINANNVVNIIKKAGVSEVHLSGKGMRESDIEKTVACGRLPEFQRINVTQQKIIEAISKALANF